MRLKLILSASIFAAVGSANAFVWTFNDILQGTQEVPPNASPATGFSTGTYDDVSNMMMIHTEGTGFVANVTAAHIHKAPPGSSGGVIFPLTGATGSTSYVSDDMFTYSEAQEADLKAGLHYVNIHSTQFPGGEIRGQLHLVPEPASMIAIAAGLGALVVRRRKR